MGQCCSAPTADAVDIRAARHSVDAPPAGGFAGPWAPPAGLVAPAALYRLPSGGRPKHLLRAATSPQQQQHQHQHQRDGSNRSSWHQLQQQLLPSAPLAQLATVTSGVAGGSSHAALGGVRAPEQQQHSSSSAAAPASPPALTPEQLISLCAAVVQQHSVFGRAGITPLLLASIALIESGGCPGASAFRDDVDDDAHGLCKMLLSTARWLAVSKGFTAFGSTPSTADLHQPAICVYYCAAYLTVLSTHKGSPRSEAFVVRAYHAGPKAVESASALLYLQKYAKAKACLLQVGRAATVTVAVAALAAGVALPDPARLASPAAAVARRKAAAVGGLKAAMPAATGTGISTAKAPAAADTAAAARACDTSGAADSKDQDRDSTAAHTQSDAAAAGEVLVRSAAADLIALLTSSWGSAEPCDAAGLAAAGSTTGGFLAGMRLPWNLGSHKQQQQAADARQLGRAGSSNAAAAGGGVRSCRSLVRVSRAQLEAAWQQLVAVSPLAARAALDQAAAAAALAPHAAATRSLSPSPASSGSSVVGGISNTLRRASSSSSSKGGAACAAPDDAGAASMPTCMHVVGHGETLASIAAACGVAVADLLAVNPELPAGEGSAAGLQHHDCIALPVPAVFPRLAVAQAGDSIHTIARRHRVPAGRLLKANPELRDAGRLQPGWVVLLPGLNGSSSSSIAMDCLAGVAAVEADAHHPAAAGAEDDTFELEADSWVRLVPQQEQQQERSASSLRQQDMPTAASWPGGATLQRQRLQQPRRSDSSAATRTNSGRPSSGSSGSSGSDEPFTPIPAGFVTPVSSKGSSASQQHRRQPLRNVPLPTVGSGAYLFVTRR